MLVIYVRPTETPQNTGETHPNVWVEKREYGREGEEGRL